MTKVINLIVEADDDKVDLVDFASKIKGAIPSSFEIIGMSIQKKKGKKKENE